MLPWLWLCGEPAVLEMTGSVVGGHQTVTVAPNPGNMETKTEKLKITQQPQNAEIPEGGTATFTVAAEGSSAISCQWYFGRGPYAFRQLFGFLNQ